MTSRCLQGQFQSVPRLDDRAFLLGGTAEVPVQEHGPLRVMQAWAPVAKAWICLFGDFPRVAPLISIDFYS